MPVDLGPRYECLREIGRGGAARIFLVRDLHLRKDLALKLLHDPPLTKDDLEQVGREFAVLSEVEHPGIARAHDFGYLGGLPFFTSEFIEGDPLSARSGPWSKEDLQGLARDLAEALAFLHSSGILHLDIKASNVIVPRSPRRRRAVLIDFGLFRRGASVRPGSAIRGSLPYMAPEYFQREELGPWTDIYALGVTLYRAATGAFPRAGASDASSRLEDPSAWDPAPRPPSELCNACSPDMDRIILKCLALSPPSRFRSGADLLAALASLEGGVARESVLQASVRSIIGRTRELAEADCFLDDVVQGKETSSSLLVTGPPGIGQTHFLCAL